MTSKYFQAHLDAMQLNPQSWTYPALQVVPYDQSLLRILPEDSEVLCSNLLQNKPSNFHVRLSFHHQQHVVWEGLMPRRRDGMGNGYLVYHSPISSASSAPDGAQLCIRLYESQGQRLRVCVQDIPGAWQKEDQETFLLYDELVNRAGERTELHATFDGGLLALDIWVPASRIGKGYPFIDARYREDEE